MYVRLSLIQRVGVSTKFLPILVQVTDKDSRLCRCFIEVHKSFPICLNLGDRKKSYCFPETRRNDRVENRKYCTSYTACAIYGEHYS